MLRLDVIDVGYGDCLVIRAPGDRTAMVDCGPAATGPRVAQFLSREKIDRLDLLVITHPHPDHQDGLTAFIDNVEIGRLLHSGLVYEESLQAELFRRAERLGIPFSQATPGMAIGDLGAETRLEVLALGEFPDNMNNSSMVLRMSYGEHRFLLLADAEGDAERSLLQRFGPEGLTAHFVKVGHHGHRGDEEFIRIVSPEVAVVTLGPNQYGAPDEQTLMNWRRTGADLYQTDIHGDVSVVSDGKTLAVKCGVI
jgi:competence protein ComEC